MTTPYSKPWKEYRGQTIIPLNAKIADISQADTNKHFLNLQTAIPETRKIVAVMINSVRTLGSRFLYVYPNEGPYFFDIQGVGRGPTVVIKDGSQRLQYSQTVANNSFELYCLGYVIDEW